MRTKAERHEQTRQASEIVMAWVCAALVSVYSVTVLYWVAGIMVGCAVLCRVLDVFLDRQEDEITRLGR